MSINYLIQLCSNCHKPHSDICKPCPHCGYQHPLTEAGKEYCKKKLLEEKKQVE